MNVVKESWTEQTTEGQKVLKGKYCLRCFKLIRKVLNAECIRIYIVGKVNVGINPFRAAFYLCIIFFESKQRLLQCFQKKYTSEFWSVCCYCSKMNCQYLPREKKRRRIRCSTHEIFSSWSSYNIFFKILRYTSSENTVARELKKIAYVLFSGEMKTECIRIYILWIKTASRKMLISWNWKKLPKNVFYIKIIRRNVRMKI